MVTLIGAERMGFESLPGLRVPICEISNAMPEQRSSLPGRINPWPTFPYLWLWSAARRIPNFLNAHGQSPSTMNFRTLEISLGFTHDEPPNFENAADCGENSVSSLESIIRKFATRSPFVLASLLSVPDGPDLVGQFSRKHYR